MEESGEKSGQNTDMRWIVDPLDGTMNFLHGLPHWSISIALEEKGEIVSGLVFDPIKDEMFRAEKGMGAFVGRHRLRVSGRKTLQNSVIVHGAARRNKDYEAFFKEYRAVWESGAAPRRYGSAALDLSYVAAGRFEGFWERDLSIWDIAAGILIVKESGGLICDMDDDRKSSLETGHIIAANSNIFTDLKQILRKA